MATATAQVQCTPLNNRFSHATSSPLETHSSQHWHFPGPSSRFNQRERANTHSRGNITHAVTPSLYTERRAHRRAHSSYHLPTSAQLDRAASRKPHMPHARFTSPHSPASSERSPLSRFPSFTSPAMEVVTPGKAPPSSKLYGSPFSDYFTDDNRSIDEITSQDLPDLETQKLLVRLSRIQSALMRRGNDSQALYAVGRRMSEIESDMESLHSQSRQPPELDDSGLFMQEPDDDEESEPEKKESTSFLDGAVDERPPYVVEAESDEDIEEEAVVMNKAHDVLSSITFAHQELRKQFEEVKNIRERFTKTMKEKEEQLQALRNENNTMLVDMWLDREDFVQLDEQIKLAHDQVLQIPGTDKLNLALDAMRADCRKAIGKVMDKRRRYSDIRSHPGEQPTEELVSGEWKLDVMRDPTGRVASMVLKALPEDESASVFETTLISAEHFNRDSKPHYADKGLQTDIALESEVDELDEDLHDEYDIREELKKAALEQGLYSHECAITTSPPSELDDDTTDNDNMNGTKTRDTLLGAIPPKSAWHELWNGMAELAGVGEHRW